MNDAMYQEIFRRKSVRRFTAGSLSPEVLKDIEDIIGGVEKIDEDAVVIVRMLAGEAMISRLDTAVNAPYYLVIYCDNGPRNLVNAGYMLEQIQLALSAKGLGTCCLHMMVPDDNHATVEGLPYQVTMAVGYAQGSVRRNDVSEFDRKPLSQITNGGPYDEELEAVRLAPSVTNAQMWYFEQGEQRIRAYHVQNFKGGYTFFKLHVIGMGLALCHLKLAGIHTGRFDHFAYEYDEEANHMGNYVQTVCMN